jgi:hypothetical protein
MKGRNFDLITTAPEMAERSEYYTGRVGVEAASSYRRALHEQLGKSRFQKVSALAFAVDGLFRGLEVSVRDEFIAHVKLLANHGPDLCQPTVRCVKGAKHADVKELHFNEGVANLNALAGKRLEHRRAAPFFDR